MEVLLRDALDKEHLPNVKNVNYPPPSALILFNSNVEKFNNLH